MAGYSDGFGGAADAFDFMQHAGSDSGRFKQIPYKRKKISKKQKKAALANWLGGGGSITAKSGGGKGKGGTKHRPAGSPRGGQFF